MPTVCGCLWYLCTKIYKYKQFACVQFLLTSSTEKSVLFVYFLLTVPNPVVSTQSCWQYPILWTVPNPVDSTQSCGQVHNPILFITYFTFELFLGISFCFNENGCLQFGLNKIRTGWFSISVCTHGLLFVPVILCLYYMRSVCSVQVLFVPCVP